MMKTLIATIVGLFLFSAPLSAQSLVWEFYGGETAVTMQSRYVFGLVLDNAASPQIAVVACVDASRTCSAPLPTFQAGTTHTVALRVACSSAPTLWGAPSPTRTFTVGQPIPTVPVDSTPPPTAPCAPAPQPPSLPPASPGGTTLPPASSLIDDTGSRWTLEARKIMRSDGTGAPAQVADGTADLLLWFNGSIYAQNKLWPEGGSWWRWQNAGWSQIPQDPRTPTPPSTPPVPPAPVISMKPTQCRYTATAPAAPDNTMGWRARFRRDGVNFGVNDATAPYEQPTTAPPGVYRFDVVWTKANSTISVTSASVTTTVDCR